MKDKLLTLTLCVSRIIFGLTFVFSGFVKAVDPMGSAYKFMDYFRAFDLIALNTLAVPLALLLSAIEFTIGVAIVLGLTRKPATRLGFLFMLIFTPLTLYLAIANPVKDCGCFGEALILSNWQTFAKNVLLFAMSLFMLRRWSSMRPLFSHRFKYIPSLFAFFYAAGISVIALYDMPILDFRPFKTGTNIVEAMQSDTSNDIHVLVYKQNGKKKEFTLDNYPADDSTWTFVETKTIRPEGAKDATITDFFITDTNGEDFTNEILTDPRPTFLLISPDWDVSDDSFIDKINSLHDYAVDMDYAFYAVSSQDTEKEFEWMEDTGAEYPFLYSDATILETIIRPLPGIVFLIDGHIVWKKHPRNLPTHEVIEKQIAEFNQKKIEKSNPNKIILYAFLVFFVPILLLLCFDKLMKENKSQQGKI